jgi:hypothetical protein
MQDLAEDNSQCQDFSLKKSTETRGPVKEVIYNTKKNLWKHLNQPRVLSV